MGAVAGHRYQITSEDEEDRLAGGSSRTCPRQPEAESCQDALAETTRAHPPGIPGMGTPLAASAEQ